MSTRQFLEVEAKFSVDNDADVPALTEIEHVAEVHSETHELSAVYYDTPDLRLTRHKITLRRRTGGTDSGWHMKLPASHGRVELHADLTEPEYGEYVVPCDLLFPVRAIVRDVPLEPIAQVDNVRKEFALTDIDGKLVGEFCDDRVTSWSLLPHGQRQTWREWEFEVGEEYLDDIERTLGSATKLLEAAGATQSKSPSKLVAALGDSIEHAPKPPTPAKLDKKNPAYAVVKALAENRDALLANDPKVRRDEWDSIHQMRVATRELRSHMQTFEGILVGDGYLELESELKHLAGVLGVARDAEVVEERFHDLLQTVDADVIDAVTRKHLEQDMAVEYRNAHSEVVELLESQRYFDLLNSLDSLLANPQVADVAEEDCQEETPEGILVTHLDDAYARLVKRHEKAVSRWGDLERPLREREGYFHDMRKSAKKLRYAADAARATGLKTKKLYEACKRMQTVLGDFQDSVTSRDVLLRKAGQAREAGEDTFAYGVLFQVERERGLESLRDYATSFEKIEKAYEAMKKAARKSHKKKKG
ncbi:CYTH and CHAD domain-containing protein [Corynebacterium sp.]|uniref:CYTH and CHAD domain-containing protein n=1 Tax=Corynebacterium sp. TaxID=1720 RepID=UPI0026DDCA9D|nr:CYTH and CHAD domain-containing protein [Corynebacterium sp.]MDO5076000.1 CYTH and CHAD domain-containing protein [Corynebacterium sp.]